MKRAFLSVAAGLCAATAALADSAVVFNEIMYHPAGTNEAALEWVELHNQHAVDIDLSGWRLDGGIDFDFPRGTFLRGGGFLVIASSPAALIASGAPTNVVGPFRNRLSNAGDRIVLRNHDSRVIDEVEYGVEDERPVAPDGAGPSLARRARNIDGGNPASWRQSQQIGGTPGRTNTFAALPLPIAFNEFSSTTNAAFWIELVNFGATNVDVGGLVLVRFGGTTNREFILPPSTMAPGSFLQLTTTNLGFGVDSGDRLVLYSAGKSNVLDALVAKKEPRGRSPDGTGRWQFPTLLTPGASNSFHFRDELVINEIFYNPPPFPERPAVFTNDVFISLTNQWRWFAQGAAPPGAWEQPSYNDAGWEIGQGVFHAPTNLNLAVPKGTRLPLTNDSGARIITFYFRTTFLFNGPTNGLSLTLRPVVDDGAVFYLNGTEVHRMNLPGTNILYGTLALTNVGLPAPSAPVALGISSIVPGLNTLAVEVHQVVPNSSDVGFACELAAVRQLSPAEPFRESNEAWIEIHNRSSNAVNLGGWRIDEGIDYRFSSNTTIPANGYLVLARDVGLMLSNYPGIAVVGPYTNQLSRNGERISLKDPNNNVADEVHYVSGGRWPEAADGGGSSLELKDARADNSIPEAWAASDESNRAPWQTYVFRGVSAPGQAGEPTLWHEFVLCLLDGAGEVLLDDISVIETPATTPKQLIVNGTFDGGSKAHWRFLGNHRHSRVEPEPGNPANHVLRLVSRGAGEYQGNQVETTLTNNVAIVDGREYEISFRARWLSGKNLLNSRLYFNRLARTVALPLPSQHGTPGAPNSRRTPNIGPTFDSLAHAPVVPAANQPVTVSVRASDPDGVAGLTLKYSVNGGPWQSNTMQLTNGVFAGVIPGQAAARIVQFYVEGVDQAGAAAFAPAAGPDSRALYVVQDGQTVNSGAHHVRLIMTPADAAFIHTPTNTLSNELLGSTIIYDESEAYYDVGVRLKGSFVGRNVDRVGFHLQFPDDRLFRGEHRVVSVDRSQHTAVGAVGEIITKHVAAVAGGIPGMYDDIARFIHAAAPSYTGMSTLRLTGFDGEWLDAQFTDGGDGEVFEVEVLRWMLATVDGNPESPKQVGNQSGGTGYANLEVRDWGDSRENYRWFLLKVNNRTEDKFARAIEWAKTLGLTGTNFDARASEVMDVDQFLRVMAFQSLVGPADAYYTGANIHNFRVYVRPDQKVLYMPWDWDSSFQRSATASLFGSGNIAKLVNHPHNRRRYLFHLNDIIRTTYNNAYMSRWTAHYGAIALQDLGNILSYINNRANYVLGQLPTAAFAITNNGGNNFTVTNGTLVLGGTAPLSVGSIVINGVAYPPTWLSDTVWRVVLPLSAGVNSLVVTAADRTGAAVSNIIDTITVTNTGPSGLLPVIINEWMADNAGPGGIPDPADGLFQDWFELFNPNATAVHLGGWHLTDNLSVPDKWRIPANTWISAGGFLVVWADNNTNQNSALGGTNVDLHAGFSLNNGGESIGLFAADGATPISVVTFGSQLQNVSQGRFPDGTTNGMHFMTNYTPRAANTVASPAPASFVSIERQGGSIVLRWSALSGRAYRVQWKASLADPAASWNPLEPIIRANGPIAEFTDTPGADAARFYRVLLLQ